MPLRLLPTRANNRHPPARHAAQLRKLMRHADVQTTMKFYVDHDADELAAKLWER